MLDATASTALAHFLPAERWNSSPMKTIAKATAYTTNLSFENTLLTNENDRNFF